MFRQIIDLLLARYRNPLGVVAVSFGLIPFMAPKEQPYVYNFRHTVNIFEPGPKWPVEKLFTPVEKQVYDQFGKPDCFRLFYDSKGEIKVRSVLQQEWKGKDLKSLPPFSWVYLQRGEEIVFTNNSFKPQPLSDVVKVVISSGDPESVKDIGNGLITWTYYSTGKIYTISGDKIVATKDFPPMGSFHK